MHILLHIIDNKSHQKFNRNLIKKFKIEKFEKNHFFFIIINSEKNNLI